LAAFDTMRRASASSGSIAALGETNQVGVDDLAEMASRLARAWAAAALRARTSSSRTTAPSVRRR
jgi:hypothetical protein